MDANRIAHMSSLREALNLRRTMEVEENTAFARAHVCEAAKITLKIASEYDL